MADGPRVGPGTAGDGLRNESASAGAALGAIALPLAVTIAVQTAVALVVYGAPVMAPVAAPDLGVTPAWIGYFVSLVYVGSMFGSLVAGGLVARFGPIRMSQIGLMLCLLGILFAVASHSLPLVGLGAVLIGLGYGPTTPSSSQILIRAAPPSLISITFSIKQTGVPLGGVIAGALIPTLILLTGNWRWAALGVGLTCLALAFAIQPTRRRYDIDLNAAAPMSLRAAFAPLAMIFADRALAELAVVSFVYAGVQVTMVTYLVIFLTGSFGMTLVLAGFVLAVSQVASMIGRVLWGFVADRLLTRRTMLGLLGLGMGLSALATLAASPAWPLPLLFLFASVFGATAVGWNGVFLAEVARLSPPGQAGRATGACMFFTFLGVVVSPPVFSLALSVGGGYAGAYAVFGGPALLIGAWLLCVRREQR